MDALLREMGISPRCALHVRSTSNRPRGQCWRPRAVHHPRRITVAALQRDAPSAPTSSSDERLTSSVAGLLNAVAEPNERSQFEFTFERWKTHRSSTRYVRHMLGIIQSTIVRDLAQPLSCVAAVSIGVACYENLLAEGSIPAGFPSFLMPTAPFDLTSFALALLLVFRTNTSYDRFLEAATAWSGLNNRARDTMRQVISHLSDSSGAISPLAAAMCRWVVAYSYCLKAQLTEPSRSDLAGDLAEVLTPAEIDQVLRAHHRPSFALTVLTELGAAAPLRESHRIRLDENLTYLEDLVGNCERILKMPIPLSYSRHTSRFMVIWLTALPLGLYSTCGWATVPLSLTIAFLLLGIDQIGVEIEFPFDLLPLDDMCADIQSDLYCLLRESTMAKDTAREAARAALGELKVEGAHVDGIVVAQDDTTSDDGGLRAMAESSDAWAAAGPFSPLPVVGAKRSTSPSRKEWTEVHPVRAE